MTRKIPEDIFRLLLEKSNAAKDFIDDIDNNRNDGIYWDLNYNVRSGRLCRDMGNDTKPVRILNPDKFKELDFDFALYEIDDSFNIMEDELDEAAQKLTSEQNKLNETDASRSEKLNEIELLKKESDDLRKEIRRMLRPIIERSNAMRKIQNKKSYTGYVLTKVSYSHNLGGMCMATLETPYPIDLPSSLVKEIIINDMRSKINLALGIDNECIDNTKNYYDLSQQELDHNTLYDYEIISDSRQRNKLKELIIYTTHEIDCKLGPIPNPSM